MNGRIDHAWSKTGTSWSPSQRRYMSSTDREPAAAPTLPAVKTRSSISMTSSSSSLPMPTESPTTPSSSSTMSTGTQKNAKFLVLHGRVVRQPSDYGHDDEVANATSAMPLPRLASVRDNYNRRAVFYKLKEETQEFHDIVTKLDTALRAKEAAAAAAATTSHYYRYGNRFGIEKVVEDDDLDWRIRILTKSAQDKDKDLWEKLFAHEKTLSRVNSANDTELRSEQTSCLKLHRDFKATQKTLLMCLSLAESYASRNISKTGNVGWTGMKSPAIAEEKKEEYFEPIAQPPRLDIPASSPRSVAVEDDSSLARQKLDELAKKYGRDKKRRKAAWLAGAAAAKKKVPAGVPRCNPSNDESSSPFCAIWEPWDFSKSSHTNWPFDKLVADLTACTFSSNKAVNDAGVKA